MKIAIPVDRKDLEGKVYPSFGRTPYFLIYEADTRESMFIDNGAVSSQGGAGIKAAQVLVDYDVKTLIAPRCGQNAAEVIIGAGMEIYKAEGDGVQHNIAGYMGGTLSPLTDIHPGFHHHGGK